MMCIGLCNGGVPEQRLQTIQRHERTTVNDVVKIMEVPAVSYFKHHA
jgi:hypothetical protein